MYLKKDSVVFAGVFLFLALIISATAGDISGKWIVPGPNINVVLVFKVDGTTLTGTLSTSSADLIEIKDGKIKEDKISFYVERTMHQKKAKIRFKGTVVGDVISFGSSAEFVGKKLT